MILNNNPLIISYNLKNEINLKNLYNYIIKTRKIPNIGYNYLLNNNKDLENLYDVINNKILNTFKKTNIINTEKRCWAFVTDKKYNKGSEWHNHVNTSTINTVFYLKTVKDKGIDFKLDDFYLSHYPLQGELLIFPNYLNHLPHVSKNKIRIAINIEFLSKLNVSEIFNLKNLI
jgi:hypothetical protein